MSDTVRFWISAVIMPLVIGAGSSFLSTRVTIAQLEIKYDFLAKDVERNEVCCKDARNRIDALLGKKVP